MTCPTLKVSLPWPPSVNHTYIKGRILTDKAKIFRILARNHVRRVMPATWAKATAGFEFSVTINAFPPDFRRRDLDNLLKATLDALQFAGVYLDDAAISIISIERQSMADRGRLDVLVEAFDPMPEKPLTTERKYAL